MVTIQTHEEMYRSFVQAKERAKKTSRSILVSIITSVETVDPLAFFLAGKALYKGERTFWADPKRETTLVGLGSVHTIQSNSVNRFQQVEKEWKSILTESIATHNQIAPATGPVLMGGFSFDPLRKKTSLWQQYPDTRMILPQFLLTVTKDGQTWLTLNTWIHERDDIAKKVFGIQQIQTQLLSVRNYSPCTYTNQVFQYQNIASEEWMQAVDQVAAEIRARKSYCAQQLDRAQPLDKAVLARELRVFGTQEFIAEDVLYRLQEEQPLSYMFALESGEDCFLGASPERLVKRENNICLSTCLAGSIGRGKTPEEDEQLGEELLHDKKNMHEHAVVVSMIRSALTSFCDEIQVPEQPIIYRVRDIQHLYTPVVGFVKPEVSILSLVERLHPTPALGGFPKKLALEKIRQHEGFERGFYGAPIGWMDSAGNGEFAVAIRSGLLQGDEASLFAGCGIVGESDSNSEYKETQLKFKPMISALGGTWNDRK